MKYQIAAMLKTGGGAIIKTASINILAPVETSQCKIQLVRGIEINESGEISLVAYWANNAGSCLPEIKQNCDRL